MIYKKDGTLQQPWAFLVLYFNKKVKPLYHPDQGRDMLLIALIFEIARIGIYFYQDNIDNNDLLKTGMIALILLFLLWIVTLHVFPIKGKDIGLRKLSTWNNYEMIYLLLMVPIGFVIFGYFTKDKLVASLHENGSVLLLISFIFYMAWGFYQEWIYRGLLQTELTRKYGAFIAILLANIIFTLGPLHFYQLYQGKYMLIGVTFLIGLIFGILYHRSYNLWIVGILHGICNWFLAGLP
jgi:membrane protease YdiL (CAAX protease family)